MSEELILAARKRWYRGGNSSSSEDDDIPGDPGDKDPTARSSATKPSAPSSVEQNVPAEVANGNEIKSQGAGGRR
jgi:hypothetical protein